MKAALNLSRYSRHSVSSTNTFEGFILPLRPCRPCYSNQQAAIYRCFSASNLGRQGMTEKSRASTIKKFRSTNRTSNSHFSTNTSDPSPSAALNDPNSYLHMKLNGEHYIADLKDRLDKSWAAGLGNFITGAENLIPKEEVLHLLDESLKIFKTESNVIEMDINRAQVTQKTDKPSNEPKEETLTVVGDTHGQFYDLLNLLSFNGMPSATNKYIFNGDFVDRGSFSLQVITFLLALKILHPQDVTLLRGNHETVDMNVMYGFFHEILSKYDNEVVRRFWTVFSHLPLASTIRNHTFPDFTTFVVHGGLFTTKGVTINELNRIERSTAIDDQSGVQQRNDQSSIVHDALWSDPSELKGRRNNEARGGGLLFGQDVTERFLQRNRLNLMIRSHQVRQNGWSKEHGGKCMTVFSAPNYCDSVGNKGAILKFSNKSKKPIVKEFEAVPHPPLGPMAHLQVYRAAAKI